VSDGHGERWRDGPYVTESRPPILFNRVSNRKIDITKQPDNLCPERVQFDSYRTATAPQRMDPVVIFIAKIMFE
jgi:hypothetical protein